MYLFVLKNDIPRQYTVILKSTDPPTRLVIHLNVLILKENMFKSVKTVEKNGKNTSENERTEKKTSKISDNKSSDDKLINSSEKTRVKTNEEMKHIIAAARKSTNSLKRARRELGLYLSNYERTPIFGKREITMKICVVGDFGVGKTSIVRQYCNGKNVFFARFPHIWNSFRIDSSPHSLNVSPDDR